MWHHIYLVYRIRLQVEHQSNQVILYNYDGTKKSFRTAVLKKIKSQLTGVVFPTAGKTLPAELFS